MRQSAVTQRSWVYGSRGFLPRNWSSFCYRYRPGDFRLLHAADLDARMVQLLAIGPRSTIYARFNFPGWDAPGTAVDFGPELAGLPE